MSTKTNDIVNNIIRLAKRLDELGNASMYSLLKETGYFESHNHISEDLIREALLRCPECVNQWIRFSEDKRSSAGWYFRQVGSNYEVGYFASKPANIPSVIHSDSAEACAAFIKHEIEDVRMSKLAS